MAVIGGLALTAWRHARYTRDADVLVAIDEGRFDELLAALTAAGFRPRHSPALRVIDGQAIAQFIFQPADALLPFQFDVLSQRAASSEKLCSGPCPGRLLAPVVTCLSCGRTTWW